MFWSKRKSPGFLIIAYEKLWFLKSRWDATSFCESEWVSVDNDIPMTSEAQIMLDRKQKAYYDGREGTHKDGGGKKREQSQFRKDDYYSCSKVPPSQQSHLYPCMGICVCVHWCACYSPRLYAGDKVCVVFKIWWLDTYCEENVVPISIAVTSGGSSRLLFTLQTRGKQTSGAQIGEDSVLLGAQNTSPLLRAFFFSFFFHV